MAKLARFGHQCSIVAPAHNYAGYTSIYEVPFLKSSYPGHSGSFTAALQWHVGQRSRQRLAGQDALMHSTRLLHGRQDNHILCLYFASSRGRQSSFCTLRTDDACVK